MFLPTWSSPGLLRPKWRPLLPTSCSKKSWSHPCLLPVSFLPIKSIKHRSKHFSPSPPLPACPSFHSNHLDAKERSKYLKLATERSLKGHLGIVPKMTELTLLLRGAQHHSLPVVGSESVTAPETTGCLALCTPCHLTEPQFLYFE